MEGPKQMKGWRSKKNQNEDKKKKERKCGMKEVNFNCGNMTEREEECNKG